MSNEFLETEESMRLTDEQIHSTLLSHFSQEESVATRQQASNIINAIKKEISRKRILVGSIKVAVACSLLLFGIVFHGGKISHSAKQVAENTNFLLDD